MKHYNDTQLTAGLYLVATPIGSARDITLRALDILANADVIAAEDTRTTRKLMEIHGIARAGRPILPYHDHNGSEMRPRLIAEVSSGKSVAYVSDAGTPLVADPGYALVRDLVAAGLPVTTAPGPSAVMSAISLAGLPTDRFMFAGFLPTKSAARRKTLAEIGGVQSSLVFFESAKRVEAVIADMALELGGTRSIAVCRELTKKFEQVVRGPISDVQPKLGGEIVLKGEFVLVLGPPPLVPVAEADIDSALGLALATLSVKDAARQVAEQLSIPRKRVYARALELNK